MTERFIIVERDLMLRDCGVFTGQVQIVDAHLHFWDRDRELPMQAMDGISSPDLEHAFLFNSAWAAWRFAMQFQPHWDADRRRYWGFRRWEARKDMDYFPGESRVGIAAKNPCLHGRNWIPSEVLMGATADGYEQGRKSALAEIAASQRTIQ